MKKIFMMMLATFLVLASMPPIGAVHAASIFETNENPDGTLTITKYNGTEIEVEIPSEIGDKTVSEIGNFAFFLKQLTSITIPESVKVIGTGAFGNNELTSLTIPEGVERIENTAFSSNNLTNISIPESVTYIGEMSFYNNKLTNATILGEQTIIGQSAFSSNLLTSVTIADGVTEIGNEAFYPINRLTSVTIPGSVKSIGNSAFQGAPAGSGNALTSVTIEEGVEIIGDSTFAMNQLSSVTIPNTVTGLGNSAFYGNRLISVTIPENVETLGENAFAYNQLEQVTFEGSPVLGTNAFNQSWGLYKEFKEWYTDQDFTSQWDGTSVPDGKKLYGKRLPNPPKDVCAVAGDGNVTVTFTGPEHIGGNVVTKYTVKAYVNGTEQTDLEMSGDASPIMVTGLTHDTDYTFKVTATNKAGDSVESVASESVKAVVLFETTDNDDGTVTIKKYNGTEKEIEIPSKIGGKTVSEIGNFVFIAKHLTSVIIPESVKVIGVSAFGSNQLTSVTIPEGVEVIGVSAFDSNQLTSVTIPESVKVIGVAAFRSNQLTSVTILGNDTIIDASSFSWNFLTSVAIADGVTKIESQAFYPLNRLTSVRIPGSVKSIGKSAFQGGIAGAGNELTSVTIEEGVESIEDYAFTQNQLSSITIPESMKTIGENAFAYNKLEEIIFEGKPVLGKDAFTQGSQEFKGWYTDLEFTNAWDGTSVPDEKKLYGKRVPSPPKEVSAVAGIEEATVSFTGPTHIGGNTVTGYSVKVYVGETEQTDSLTTGAVSPITVTGLTPGTAYTFKVVATNATGDSINSQSSAAVTPVAEYEATENSDGTVTLTGYNGTAKEVVIPNQINGRSVSAIGNNVFKDKGLTSVQLPKDLTTIGENAFSGNQLTNIVINEASNAIYIGNHAFSNNIIKNVTLPIGVVEIGSYAFFSNELVSVEIPSSLGTIGESAFSHNEIASVTMPFSLSALGENAFSHNRLTSVMIPPGVVMGKGAFSYNELISVTFHIGVSAIADNAFSHNKLTTVTIPVNVREIGSNAFSSNYVERVTFEGSPTIGVNAFKQDEASIFPEFISWYTDAELLNIWDGTSLVVGTELYAKRMPNPPTDVTATAGVAKASVSFTEPMHTGGNAVTKYTVKVFEGEQEVTELETTGTASPITVNRLKPRKSYTFKVIATNEAGSSKDSKFSESVIPHAPFIPSVPVSPTPQPTTEIITLPIETDNQGSVVTTAAIKRTTDPTGKKKDEIEFSPIHAAEIVPKLIESGIERARIVIPDAKDEVSELHVSFHKGAIQAFRQNAIGLEVFTENARIIIPKDSVTNVNDNLYFRVIPMKDEKQKNEVEERAKQEEVISEVTDSLNIQVVGRPMTIETNMPNQPVDIILPLKDQKIPTDAKEREEFLNKLGVFIEHSDGEKVFIKGEVVPYKEGELGLKFTIHKFSTFSIIQMEDGWKVPNVNDQYTGDTTVLEQPVMIDKIWTITFNQAANAETVNANTVYLYDEDGKKVEIESKLTNLNRSIKIIPKTYYKPNTDYYLYVSDSIESAKGKQLGTPQRYVFKTTSYSLEPSKKKEETIGAL
ncbi:leucine-rich repeat protein [Sporosarcina sp. GW1-11]|uniref:leucine-rich repeat protein n=1 Tax=Sporosarcina sp. GW1-11 TaxID=2899126 RepID=UPI00294CDD34|nr:leucine-rich repeat protein [Sporosarcina sp. GW1-11]MDV6378195.1 leucine-rich repeat protein [Sporosarcina sp. GW1-11]